jgi:hypothetical protein
MLDLRLFGLRLGSSGPQGLLLLLELLLFLATYFVHLPDEGLLVVWQVIRHQLYYLLFNYVTIHYNHLIDNMESELSYFKPYRLKKC